MIREKTKNFFSKIDGIKKVVQNKIQIVLNFSVKYFNKFDAFLYVLILSVLAVFVRKPLWNFASGDYNSFLRHWWTEIKALKGLSGFGSTIGDYSPAYKYFITIATKFTDDSLHAYKYFSCFFDYVLAVFVGLIVYHFNKNKYVAVAGYGATLFLPTLVLNGSCWAQCDQIFTCFVVMSFYFTLKKHTALSMVFYAIAFSFKLQAIFYMPCIVIFTLRKKLKWWGIFVFVITYCVIALPAMFYGMSFKQATIGAYLHQAGEYKQLSLNAPSIYQILPNSVQGGSVPELSNFGTFSTLGVLGVLCVLFFRYRYELDDKMLLLMTYFFVLLIPFLLPHMHERYFFMADIFGLIFVFVYPKKCYIALLSFYASLRVVCKYLFSWACLSITMLYMAVLVLASITLLSMHIIGIVKESNAKLKAEELQKDSDCQKGNDEDLSCEEGSVEELNETLCDDTDNDETESDDLVEDERQMTFDEI